jgi:hypothetical protein
VPELSEAQPWAQQEQRNQKEIVDWKDSQEPTRIEVLEIVWLRLGTQQDSSDQETTEHKEEIDTNPTVREKVAQGPRCSSV